MTPDPGTADGLVLCLERRDTVADGVVALTLRAPDGAQLPPWEPGAHIDIEIGDIEDGRFVRQYSLCGSPADRTTYRVAVLREPSGRGGSAWVHDRLTEGTGVTVRGPRNHFALQPARGYLFIAGGIGITPILPMVAAAAAAGADWRLVYGGRTRASMAFRDALVTAHPERVTVCPQDETGLLDLASLELEPGTLVYCCGPTPLLDAVEKRAVDWPDGVLHIERFDPVVPDEPVHRGAFDVELALTGRTLTVPPELSVLEVLEAEGVPVLSSCRDGTCGTCETAVRAGDVDHRDSLLTAAERAANDTMFVCVSRAACAKLVLEL